MKRIAIFASGTGTNAKKIVDHFRGHEEVAVVLIVSNKATAPVLKMAENEAIDFMVIDREYFYESEDMVKKLYAYSGDLVVLAGFLWLIPAYLVKAFEKRMINIHPALLPKYGGKGMYGHHVHEAVWKAKEKESGITIHFVNEHYDEGNILFQARCAIESTDDPQRISEKVRQLEHQYFARIIEKLLFNHFSG